jgi:CheY-like chemotaxis protein
LQGNGERILLVEDEDGVRRFAIQVLTDNGYRVHAASSAGEALQIYTEENGTFDLVFADQVLPGRTGLELVETLRERDPGIGVLLSSGYVGEESARRQIEGLGHTFLPKPYNIPNLLNRIRRLLDGRGGGRE